MGGSPASSRLLVVIMGSLTIVLTYFLGSHLFGRRVGITTSLFLMFNPVHWTLSRMAMPDIPLVTFFLSSIMLYIWGIEKNRSARASVTINRLIHVKILAGICHIS